MKTWSVFNKATGELIGQTFSTDQNDGRAHTPINFPDGHGVIEGLHDHLSKRVDLTTGQVIDYQPPAPSADHEWNAETKRWHLSEAAQIKAAARAAAKARIAELEASQHRHVRAAVLGSVAAKIRLQSIDSEITALEATLAD